MLKRDFLKSAIAGAFASAMPFASLAMADGDGIVEMALGADDGAKVTLIEYASFTCGHCANFHRDVFKQLKADYIDTGKIRFVYREVYFDKYGLWASMLARCEPSKFFGMAELFYKSQSTWTRAGNDAAIVDEMKKIGRLAGLSDDQMDTCLQNEGELRALVDWYRANAEEHGINSTPSFILNGVKHSNMPYTDLQALLDEALGA